MTRTERAGLAAARVGAACSLGAWARCFHFSPLYVLTLRPQYTTLDTLPTLAALQVDAVFQAAALAANQARIPLAKMAVAETRMGCVEDKVTKNHFASEYIYNKYKNTKTCGIIEVDHAGGVTKVKKWSGWVGGGGEQRLGG